ncbi:FecCD family ABC transporter permease [Flectobacillus major]|uniref:FecCD family ABC transporter permease n=1 Tax=Flectobacillus major TaxID=103 RepID=UPI00040A997A|nr:iron ABC transporter permease [Flectobacillus major]
MNIIALQKSQSIGFSYTKAGIVLTSLMVILIGVGIWAVGVGAVSISFKEVGYILLNELGWTNTHFAEQQAVILTVIRLPRVLMGILVGAVLGITGASMQGLFRNPLADPGLIGISSGASLFAVGMIVLELKVIQQLNGLAGLYGMSFVAFFGACLTTVLVYQLSKVEGKAVVTTMLLAGIAVNALSGAITGLMTYMANDAQLRTIQFWGLGSLGGASWDALKVATPLCLIPILFVPRLGKALNAFALGESQAEHLGINPIRLKNQIIILTTLGVGVSVALCGAIGFVGLIIPHIIRLFAGADHRLVLPASALLGAIVLTLADLVSRTIVAPAELPIGIVTAMLGTPIFIWILVKNRNQ